MTRCLREELIHSWTARCCLLKDESQISICILVLDVKLYFHAFADYILIFLFFNLILYLKLQLSSPVTGPLLFLLVFVSDSHSPQISNRDELGCPSLFPAMKSCRLFPCKLFATRLFIFVPLLSVFLLPVPVLL